MADLELPWWKFFPRDWVSDPEIRALSLAEKGLLVDLMSYFWIKGSLPSDTETLARIVGIPHDEFSSTWEGLRPFFDEARDGSLVHRELYEERDKLLRQKQKQREAGRRGARVRWGEDGSGSDATSDGAAKGDPNGDPMTSSDSRTQTTEGRGRQVRGKAHRRGYAGAKGTVEDVPCPECGEIDIAAGKERCSRCELLNGLE